MTDERLGMATGTMLRGIDRPPRDSQASVDIVMAQVRDTRQVGRWWPFGFIARPTIPASGRSPARGLTMFSAVKFISAGVIVTLFGGFLLAGVLTAPQGDDTAPAMVVDVSESTNPVPTTEVPATMIRSDILPGVALTVEEVDRGIYRVFHDGARDLTYQREPRDGASFPDIVAADDGGIWVVGRLGYDRLGAVRALPGDDASLAEGQLPNHGWPEGNTVSVSDFEVARDGTVWVNLWMAEYRDDPPGIGGHNLWSAREDEWTRQLPTDGRGAFVEVAPGGTVWAVWLDDPDDPESAVFGYLEADTWTSVGEWPFWWADLHLSDTGDIWADGPWPDFSMPEVNRFVDGAWVTEDDWQLRAVEAFDLAPDGSFWGHGNGRFHHFDGVEWAWFPWPDWMPYGDNIWALLDDEWARISEEESETLADDRLLRGAEWSHTRVAPDGSVWASAILGESGGEPVCTADIGGVVRFDGETWSRYLKDGCVKAMDIAADGSVWLLATESDARFPLIRTYVITPEAMAGME